MRLVFLVVLLLEHYYPSTEESAASAPTAGKTSLAFASNRYCSACQKSDCADLPAAQGSSFQGPVLSTPASCRNGGFRCLPLALSLWSQKSQDHGLLSLVHSPLENWDSNRAERGEELCYLERGPARMGCSMGAFRFISKAENYKSKAATAQEEPPQEEQDADGCRWAESVSWAGSGFSSTTADSAASATTADCAAMGALAEHCPACGSTGTCDITGGAATQGVCRPAAQVRRRTTTGSPILCSRDQGQGCQESVKTLHSAVTSMGRSRDELQAAIAARSQMHSTWRTFLADSITRFQAYGQDFATQEENLVARIQEAKKAFEQAKENLSVEKAKASSLDTTVQEVSDEETEIKDVVLAAPDKITESLNHLTSSLEGLRSQAADLERRRSRNTKGQDWQMQSQPSLVLAMLQCHLLARPMSCD